MEKKTPLSDKDQRKLFYNNLKDVLPNSSFVMLSNAEYTKEPSRPQVSQNENPFLTDKQVDAIEATTVGQAQNAEWHKQRKGRITASNFYRVFTKVKTLKSAHKDSFSSSVGAKKLIDSLLGTVKIPENLPALKYGREMEAKAKEEHQKLFEKQHQDTTYRECGIFIHKKKQYLGASPDLLIECSCCGKGVLEIKCPLSVANERPLPSNLSYLCDNDEKVTLKRNHQYFAQIQGQMAIAERHWCHFFVYTQKGHHLETIKFDASYWVRVEDNLSWFHANYLAPALSPRKN